MGLRVESDVKWYMEGNKKMQLSEDGFCKNCDEHYDDCFCLAFWVRKCASLSKSSTTLNKQNSERKKFMEDFEIARCQDCQATKKNTKFPYCNYHELKMERLGLK